MKKVICLGVMLLILLSLPGVYHKVGEYNLGIEINAMTTVDTILYVATLPYLYILDVSHPENPVLLGELFTGITNVQAIVVENNIAYLAGGLLLIVDVSDPYYPIQLSSIYIGFQHMNKSSLAICNNLAYLSTGAYVTMKVVDISDPHNPCIIGSYNAPSDILSIAVAANYVYIGMRSQGIVILDYSNIDNPILVSSLLDWSNISYMVSEDNLIVFIMEANGIGILDVTNPVDYVLYWQGGVLEYSLCKGLWIADSVVYATWNDYVMSFDVSDLHNISLIDKYQSIYTSNCVVTTGNFVIVSAWQGGTFEMIDVSVVDDTEYIGEISDIRNIYSVSVDNNIACIKKYDQFLIYDTSNPQNPSHVGSYDIAGGSGKLTQCENNIYWLQNGSGLQFISLENPNNPTLIGSYPSVVVYSHLWIDNGIAYLVDSASGLYLVNVSNPVNPYIEGYYPGSGISSLYVSRNIAYVIKNRNLLEIVNCSDPQVPTLMGMLSIGAENHAITVSQGFAYIYNYNEGILSVNIGDPFNPTIAGSTPLPEMPRYPEVCLAYNNVLYVSNNRWNRIYCYNLSQPQAPALFNTYKRNIHTVYLEGIPPKKWAFVWITT